MLSLDCFELPHTTDAGEASDNIQSAVGVRHAEQNAKEVVGNSFSRGDAPHVPFQATGRAQAAHLL